MQLVMIFQTFLNWNQSPCHPSKGSSASPILRMTLGQHEMMEEERNFVGTALISKALDRITSLLKLMITRIDGGSLQRQEKQGLQQLVVALVQGFAQLNKRLSLGQP